MKNTLFVAVAVLAATAATAQTKNPVSSTLRDILPGRQKNMIDLACRSLRVVIRERHAI